MRVHREGRTPGRPGAMAALAAMAVLALGALPAAAAQAPLWELGLGIGGLRLPHYRGSEGAQDWVLPVPYAVYRGEVLRADRTGLKAMLVDSERITLDMSAAATAPSRSADEPIRHGMPDLAGTAEIGPNLNLRLAQGRGWRLELRLPVRAAFTLESDPRSIGWTATPNLNVDHRVAGWNLGAQVGLLWGSRRQHAYFYEVAPAYATPDRPAWRAEGGRAGWQATMALSRRDGPRWMGAYVRTDSLAGSVLADSPLVRRSRSWSAGFAMSWVIWQSDRLVADRDELP